MIIRNYAFLPFIFLLASCASDGVADFRSIVINEQIVKEPTASNGYQGILVEISSSRERALNQRAAEICNSRGGLKSPPSYNNSTPIGWKFYRYACNGFLIAIIKSASAAEQPQPQT